MRRFWIIGLLAFVAGSAWNASAASSFTKTKYPIYLGEGFANLDYFQIAEALRESGATVCKRNDDAVPPFASSEARAAVIVRELEACAKANGGKVNLVGFSQGGEDARVVLKKRPDLLASVTTLSSPHRGSAQLPDLVLECFANGGPATCTGQPLAAASAFLGFGGSGFAADPQAPTPNPGGTAEEQAAFAGVLAFLCQISSGTNPAAAALCQANQFQTSPTFDATYSAGLPTSACGSGPASVTAPGNRKIFLFSLGGTKVRTDPDDGTDAFLQATSVFFAAGQNDGLVERCSSHFGTVIRDDLPWNHTDPLNQFMGQTGALNPVELIRSVANRLKNLDI